MSNSVNTNVGALIALQNLNATNADQALEIMNPRVVRLGVRVRF